MIEPISRNTNLHRRSGIRFGTSGDKALGFRVQVLEIWAEVLELGIKPSAFVAGPLMRVPLSSLRTE